MSGEPVCIDDIKERCRFDDNARRYYMSGADEEQTLKENELAFQRLRIRPRMLQGIEKIDMSIPLCGRQMSMPILIAPTAMQRMAHDVGEKGTVRAADEFNTAMGVSTLSTTSFKELKKTCPNVPLIMQMYLYKQDDLTLMLLRQAEEAGCKAVAVTVDTPILGMRREDARYGFKLPGHLKLANLENIKGLEGVTSTEGSGLMKYCAENIKSDLSWDTIDWLRTKTKLPILLKGILTREDAVEALRHDVQGIIVSNHGGRQIDGVPATIEALPEIVEAVHDKLDIYLDGGVRNGTDVFKALALGAKAVFIGRPVLWGLGYNGEAGVKTVLKILKTELERAMMLAGCCNIASITKDMVVHETYYHKL